MTIDWRQSLGWEPTPAQNQTFEQFYQLLLETNRSLNLTRITDREDFWEKHVWDSLSGLVPWLSPGCSLPGMPPLAMRDSSDQDSSYKVIDIGTGGGFPGIPAAIAFPNWQVTLLDSTQKKIKSLDQLLQSLHRLNVTTLCDRAEQLGRLAEYRAQYDLALIRAVASAPACAEYALPLVREQGTAVLYRGQWNTAEEASLAQALASLGGELCHVQSYKTPLTQSDRHCIYLKKITPTPEKYPRRVGVPTKKPLGC